MQSLPTIQRLNVAACQARQNARAGIIGEPFGDGLWAFSKGYDTFIHDADRLPSEGSAKLEIDYGGEHYALGDERRRVQTFHITTPTKGQERQLRREEVLAAGQDLGISREALNDLLDKNYGPETDY